MNAKLFFSVTLMAGLVSFSLQQRVWADEAEPVDSPDVAVVDSTEVEVLADDSEVTADRFTSVTINDSGVVVTLTTGETSLDFLLDTSVGAAEAIADFQAKLTDAGIDPLTAEEELALAEQLDDAFEDLADTLAEVVSEIEQAQAESEPEDAVEVSAS